LILALAVKMPTSVKLLLIFFIGISSISQIKPQCVKNNNPNQIGKFQKEFNKGEFEFTTDLLLAVSKATPYENVFVSPFSMYNALLLAYFGSQKATEKVIKVYIRKL
jgi:serine protease inhibitor